MSNLSLTRLKASGLPAAIVRLRAWIEQQNAEYGRGDDGSLCLGADDLFAFEQRYGGFPHDVVAILEHLFPDLTFVGYTWSEDGCYWNIEIRHGYTRVRPEDGEDWDERLSHTEDLVDPDDVIDPAPLTDGKSLAQPSSAKFIEMMTGDDTAPIAPKAIEAPPGWRHEPDPDLSGVDEIALIWELKRRGRAVISLGAGQVNAVHQRLTGRYPWDCTPAPALVDCLLADALIAERVQQRMGRAGIEEITAILDERLFGREPDRLQSDIEEDIEGRKREPEWQRQQQLVEGEAK